MSVIAFDLDGTLIDSVPDLHATASTLLEREGRTPLDLPTIRSFVGNGVPVLVQRIISASDLPSDPETHARLVRVYRDIYEAAPSALTSLYPNVIAALDALRGDGHRLAICTNKPESPTRAILAAFGLSARFKTIIGGDTLNVMKPDPAPLSAAFGGSRGDSTLFVGDSETDAATAAASGTRFALFTEGYRKTPVTGIAHDVAFGDFSLLPRIVAEVFRQQT